MNYQFSRKKSLTGSNCSLIIAPTGMKELNNAAAY